MPRLTPRLTARRPTNLSRRQRRLLTLLGDFGGTTTLAEAAEAAEAAKQARDATPAEPPAAFDMREQGILNAVPDALLGIDATGVIRSASPAVASVFGREPQELIGIGLDALLPGLDAEAAEQRTLQGMYMRASRTHVARFEAQALRHGGTAFPAEVSLARIEPDENDPQPDPRRMRYACAVRDVTDQRMHRLDAAALRAGAGVLQQRRGHL